jgi:energy-coupling factor transporter ATP-binding protein EcfA2
MEHMEIHAHAGKLKQECTVLVVSHDLRELEPLIDMAWEMEAGGRLKPVPWPPAKSV